MYNTPQQHYQEHTHLAKLLGGVLQVFLLGRRTGIAYNLEIVSVDSAPVTPADTTFWQFSLLETALVGAL